MIWSDWKETLSGYEVDILSCGLSVVFCGLNPATSAAEDRHNFSHRSNRFWSALHLAGFTDVLLRPEDERQLLKYGCGITAIVERPTQRAEEVMKDEFVQARPAFEIKMRKYAPRAIAFLGKRGFAEMMDEPGISWGQYSGGFAGSIAWILPNPSGLNRGFSLQALVSAFVELRQKLVESQSGNAGRKAGNQ